ncbi:hypothetical protein N9Y42_00340 [Mariniblastus sp.]|nr:hypothetical protein [Mariniblastus sp.]
MLSVGLGVCCWRLLLAFVLFLNCRLYWPTPLARNNSELPSSLKQQLNANVKVLTSDAPRRMQGLFPEGFFFCHALHGLTWVEAAQRDPSLIAPAVENAKLAYANLESQEGKENFPSNLPPDHGAFYSAWKVHLLAGIVTLEAQNDSGDFANDLAELKKQCDAWKDLLDRSSEPFFESYHSSVWPCDTFPAIHAMKTCDRITGQDTYQSTIDQWLDDAKAMLDPTTGLIPHSNLADGNQTGQGRATSQMIILRLLPDIDEEFARQQYTVFREQFLTSFAGIPCLFEYANGQGSSVGDVDTGPLIFGRSLSATVFMIGVAQIYEDQPVADAIATAGEAVGLPWTWSDEKRYVGGVLPIGDIMVAYSQNAKRWSDGDGQCPSRQSSLADGWRLKVHAYSIPLFLFAAFLFWRKRKRRKTAGEESVSSNNY